MSGKVVKYDVPEDPSAWLYGVLKLYPTELTEMEVKILTEIWFAWMSGELNVSVTKLRQRAQLGAGLSKRTKRLRSMRIIVLVKQVDQRVAGNWLWRVLPGEDSYRRLEALASPEPIKLEGPYCVNGHVREANYSFTRRKCLECDRIRQKRNRQIKQQERGQG